ncbi:MAG: KpsF/GutQ family sugar-phosphate isomerase [Bdellovibrionales bacterium]|nr:KpsF/GutQ family sugar-phosphate isomerase [Bdellovibrionales bacterium]
MNHDDIIEARRVLEIEANAIMGLRERLGAEFSQAVDLISQTKGKVIVTGVGKSGQIGRKIASTLSSTGTPALYVHPTESSHGDMGVIADLDAVIAISSSGESQELHDVITYCVRKGVALIGMTGGKDSSLARSSQVFLDISVKEEACPLKLAPTSSSTVTLALGDALAMAVLKRKGFNEEDFAEFHPGGSLGRKMLTRVKDVMMTGDALPVVTESTPILEVIAAMTGYAVRGAAGVVSASGDLIGVITDGDIRRQLGQGQKAIECVAKDLMSTNPKTIDVNELAQKALFVMEQFRINLLFVINSHSEHPKKPVGLLHIQDLIGAKLK